MANKLSSVLAQIANLLFAPKRGRNLLQHGDLARQFALVAPLGGGAVIALQQALRLPESDHASLSRRGRSSWGCA